MSTRQGRTLRAGNCFDPCLAMYPRGIGREVSLYLSVLCDAIELRGSAAESTPADFIIKLLAKRGGVAYNKATNKWHDFTACGHGKKYGILPRFVMLKDEDNNVWSNEMDTVKYPEICIFPANAEFYPVVIKIAELVTSLDTVEDNISQNLNNMRELALVISSNKNIKSQLMLAERQRVRGVQATAYIDISDIQEQDITALGKALEDYVKVVTLSPNAHNYLPDYLALKQAYQTELFKFIGVSDVGEKQERRIESEMAIIENSSYAFIDMLIDNINEYANLHEVDIHAHRKHSQCAIDNVSEKEAEQTEQFTEDNKDVE